MFKMLFSDDKCSMHSFGGRKALQRHSVEGFRTVYDMPVALNRQTLYPMRGPIGVNVSRFPQE